MSLKACSSSVIRECRAQKKAKDTISERDRISELPYEILAIILSSIQTRDSVRTSTLSKRWRNVWTSVPIIEIDYNSLWSEYGEDERRQSGSISLPFENWFKNFLDRLIHKYEICCLRILRLCCYDVYEFSNVWKWIIVVTGLDDLEELDLMFRGNNWVKLPSSTFTRKNLVILKLYGNINLNLPSSVCLPSLKRLHLVSLNTIDVDYVKKVLSGSPVLEKLNIERCTYTRDEMEKTTLHIQSSSLKSLTFYSTGFKYSDSRARALKMVIDATNLEQLDLMVDSEDKVCVTSSLTSLVSVDLGVPNTNSPSFRRKYVYKINVFKLLMKMSHTKYLYLSAEYLEPLQHRGLDHLPMLKNLTHCKVNFSRYSSPMLSCLLESSPNLISFVFFKKFLGRINEPDGQFCPPKCLMLYLEDIRFTTLGGGDKYEMEMARYFLGNAPALKTISITIKYQPIECVSDLYDKVIKLPKASTASKICVQNY